jgi:hypothetical protein
MCAQNVHMVCVRFAAKLFASPPAAMQITACDEAWQQQQQQCGSSSSSSVAAAAAVWQQQPVMLWQQQQCCGGSTLYCAAPGDACGGLLAMFSR